MDSATRGGEKDATAIHSGTSGLREAWFGDCAEARRRATLALNLSTGRDLQYLLHSRSPTLEMRRERKRWRTIWTRVFLKTQLCSSITCRTSAEGLLPTKEMLPGHSESWRLHTV